MIRCSYCKTENADSVSECKQCGKPISDKRTCDNPHCRLDLSEAKEDFQFCPNCGKELSRLPIESYVKSTYYDYKGYKIDMSLVEAGTFVMGATEEQNEADPNEFPPHRVVIAEDFYMSKIPVTRRLWKLVMGAEGVEKGLDLLPIEVSFDKAKDFCQKLSVGTGVQFRLPTEAEWEYAARGGKYSKHIQYSGSDSLDEVGWFMANSKDRVHDVGLKAPNELGIYDMCGNTREFCLDSFTPYLDEFSTSPCYQSGNKILCLRGGVYYASWQLCRTSSREEVKYFTDEASIRLVIDLSSKGKQIYDESCPYEECKCNLHDYPKDMIFCPSCGKRIRNSWDVYTEKVDWKKIESINDNNKYVEFVDKYPNGIYESYARKILSDDSNCFNENKKTIDGCKKYLKKHPHGIHILEAITKIEFSQICNNSMNWESFSDLMKERYGFFSFTWSGYHKIRKVASSAILINSFWGNLLIRNYEGKMGLCNIYRNDRAIEMYLPPQYDFIAQPQHSAYFIIKKDGKWGLFRGPGAGIIGIVLDCEYDIILPSGLILSDKYRSWPFDSWTYFIKKSSEPIMLYHDGDIVPLNEYGKITKKMLSESLLSLFE